VFPVRVTGFAFATACSQLGMLETGTNTELAKTSGKMTTKPADCRRADEMAMTPALNAPKDSSRRV
jgi:hypothetical protein